MEMITAIQLYLCMLLSRGSQFCFQPRTPYKLENVPGPPHVIILHSLFFILLLWLYERKTQDKLLVLERY